MRRPRPGFVTPHPGGPGNPPEGTRTLCEELADWDCAQASSQKSADPAPVSCSRKWPQDAKPRWSAERRPRSREGTRQNGRLVRHSVLHPLGIVPGEKRDDGVPGAAKNTGDGARLLFEI